MEHRPFQHSHIARNVINQVIVQTCHLISCVLPWRLRYDDDELPLFFAFVFTLDLKKLGAHVQAWNVGPPNSGSQGPGLCPPPPHCLITLLPTVVRNCLLFGLMTCFADLIVIAEPKGERGTGFSWKNLAQR